MNKATIMMYINIIFPSKYFFHLLPKMKLSSENGHNFLKSFTLTLPKSLKLNMKHILKVLDLNHIYPQQTQ